MRLQLLYICILTSILAEEQLKNSSVCQSFLTSNMGAIKNIFYSGKQPNEFGDYHNCILNENNRYYVFETKIQIPLKLGLCVPKECSKEEILGKMQPLAKDNKIVVKEPAVYNANIKHNWWTIMCISVVSTILLCCLVGTILKAKLDKEKKQAQARENIEVGYQTDNATDKGGDMQNKINQSDYDGSIVQDVQVIQKKKKRNLNELWYVRFLCCFSVIDNSRRLCEDKRQGDQQLNVFNGIRVISMVWVIMGHEYQQTLQHAKNIFELEMTLKHYNALVAAVGLYSVDIFFFMSGFFLSMVIISKYKNKMNPLTFYIQSVIHRALRIWPIYIFTGLVYSGILPFLGDGPVFEEFVFLTRKCKDVFWKNLLFINNQLTTQEFVNVETCVGWSWYLAVDFQVFLVGLFLIIIYKKNQTFGKLLMFLVFIGSFNLGFFYFQDKKISSVTLIGLPDDHFKDYYIRPSKRIMPYIIGMFFGIHYKNVKSSSPQERSSFFRNLKVKTSNRVLLYVIGAIIMIVIGAFPYPELEYVFSNPIDTYYGYLIDSFFNTIKGSLFSVGLMIFIYPIIFGDGQTILYLFGNPLFNILGKITFGVYLIHYMIIHFVNANRDFGLYFSNYDVRLKTLNTAVLAFMASFLVSVFVELSCVQLETNFLMKKKHEKKMPQSIQVKLLEK